MTGATPTASASLQGRRILVVEDEFMIAREVADAVNDAGGEALGPVPGVRAAFELIASEAPIDGALLDVNLRNEMIWPVVDALLARSIPLVLATGYDASAIPAAYRHLPCREKPTTGKDLLRALARALGPERL